MPKSHIANWKILLSVLLAGSLLSSHSFATAPNPEEKDQKSSPWLFAPTISSDPKVGTSLGGLAGYIYKFDEKSPASMFTTIGNYSNTDSFLYSAFGKMHFQQDQHRVVAMLAGGEIKNDYDDFLGSGLPAQTTDDMYFYGVRYFKRLPKNYFIGAQAFSSNYLINGEDAITDLVLDILGLTGFDSNGLGLVFQHDNRDNTYSPSAGGMFQLHNIAYRESLGGDVSFDAYQARFKRYWGHSSKKSDDHVLAFRLEGRWTSDAPPSGYSSVDIRGYVRGNYINEHMTVIEVEERYALGNRWGVAGFTGVACLYEKVRDCDTGDNLYPAIGGGLYFYLKEKEKIAMRLTFAKGESDNSGFYLKFGQPF